MKSSIQLLFLFLLGLVASAAIPLPTPHSRPRTARFAIAGFQEVCCSSVPPCAVDVTDGTQACHSVLTSCRAGADCCPGLECKTYDGDSFCVPGG
ncbi:hypothetical protein BT67DRAFT_387527 [Trichocladium antarcticum]|uniref:Uncharacterized protein n=1 Tax=Trichocladium antarcticum TaxID=1450529 RepID=A0AAN6UF83_9PEZI|nr:hypothetical protein BT67DRAFT_387527 [Trichocladium antarcticum]